MGVKGLWQVLEPVGKPISLESLEGKPLAIDVSVWLHQAVKGAGAHRREGRNPHIPTLLHRLLKLLFYRVRPVVVFDGLQIPHYKRRTLTRRRLKREIAGMQLNKIQKRILGKLAEKQAVASVRTEKHGDGAERDVEAEGALHALQFGMKSGADAMFELPSDSIDLEDSGSDGEQNDISEDERRELDEEIEGYLVAAASTSAHDASFASSASDLDVNSEGFKGLPIEIQRELLIEAQDLRKDHRSQREALPSDANDFSDFQLDKILKRSLINRRLDDVNKELSARETATTVDWLHEKYGSSSGALNVKKIIHENWKEKQILFEDIIKDDQLAEAEQAASTSDTPLPVSQLSTSASLEGLKLRLQTQLSSEELGAKPMAYSSPLKNEPNIQELSPFPECGKTTLRSSPGSPLGVLPTAETEPINQEIRITAVIDERPPSEQEALDSKPTTTTNYSSVNPTVTSSKKTEVNAVATFTSSGSVAVNERLEEGQASLQKPGPSNSSRGGKATANSQEPSASQKKKQLYPTFIVSSEEAGSVDERRLQASSDDDSDLVDVEDLFPAEETAPPVSVSVSQGLEKRHDPEMGEPSDLGQQQSGDARVNEKFSGRSAVVPDFSATTESLEVLEQQRRAAEGAEKTMTEQIYEDCQELLRLLGIPWMVAPGEAEAQCAVLESQGQVTGTVTEDSDIWLFGGRKVYRHVFNKEKNVQFYSADDVRNTLGLAREKLIQIAILTGCDYTDGVENVGVVAAMEILGEFRREGEELQPLLKFKEFWEDAQKGSFIPGEVTSTKSRLSRLQCAFPPSFPDSGVWDAFLKPNVNHSEEKFTWGLPNVEKLKTFLSDKIGWTERKTEETLIPIMARIKARSRQTHISSFAVRLEKDPKEMKVSSSKRVESAVRKLLVPSATKGATETTHGSEPKATAPSPEKQGSTEKSGSSRGKRKTTTRNSASSRGKKKKGPVPTLEVAIPKPRKSKSKANAQITSTFHISESSSDEGL